MRDDAHRDKSQENMDLSSLSVADLEAQLEEALQNMTEETYDESVVEAYMKALEEKSPMPDMPDTATAYASFLHRLGEAEKASLHRPRRKVVRFRMAFVAVLAVAALLGGWCWPRPLEWMCLGHWHGGPMIRSILSLFMRQARGTAQTWGGKVPQGCPLGTLHKGKSFQRILCKRS